MRSVIGITFLALIAQAAEQAPAEQAPADQAANDKADDQDLETMLSNMDDETMDKVADKLIDKLLGGALNSFNLSNSDLTNTELFKMPTHEQLQDLMGKLQKEQTPEERQQMEEQAAVLAEAAADAAAQLAQVFTDAYNNADAYNRLADEEYLPQDGDLPDDREALAPHAEDVCENRGFNQDECEAQGAGCCFYENNACWAAVDGACEVATEPTELDEEAPDEQAPNLATVILVGLASVVVGSVSTYVVFAPRFRVMTEKTLPLLTGA